MNTLHDIADGGREALRASVDVEGGAVQAAQVLADLRGHIPTADPDVTACLDDLEN